jgi:anti-sigma factor RsiW
VLNTTWRKQSSQSLGLALSSGAVRFKAPAALQMRILASLGKASKASSPSVMPWRWLAIAASLAFVVVSAWSLVRFLSARPAEDPLANEVLASHVRSLLAEAPVERATSNQHQVKPWLAGKVGFAPQVKDLTTQDFALLGGRVDYLDNRPVAALVYQRREHKINLFIWPAAQEADTDPKMANRQGYNLFHWTKSGMTYWAISDLNSRELQEFVQLIREG